MATVVGSCMVCAASPDSKVLYQKDILIGRGEGGGKEGSMYPTAQTHVCARVTCKYRHGA